MRPRDIPRAQDQLFDRAIVGARQVRARSSSAGRVWARCSSTKLVVLLLAARARRARASRCASSCIRALLGACGRNVVFGQNVVLRHPHKIHIGDNVVIDDNCLLDAKGDSNRGHHDRQRRLHRPQHDPVVQERRHRARRRRQHRLQLRDLLGQPRARRHGHADRRLLLPHRRRSRLSAIRRRRCSTQARTSAGVTVGDGAWLGAGAKILDGVTIGDGAVIGAGAVVRDDGAAAGDRRRRARARRRHARRGGQPVSDRSAGAERRAAQTQRPAGLRSPRLGRLAHARREASLRVDDSRASIATRFNVSLVSLRKKDLSEETLDSFGVDITYLHKSKFDPATLPALLKVIDRKQIDILHLHGYGATTFGRVAGGDAADPDDPARAREPDRHAVVPEDRRHVPRAAAPTSRSPSRRARPSSSIKARQIPAEKVKVVYLGVPLEEFSRARSARRDRGRPRRARHRARRVRHRHGHAAARLEGQLVSRRRRPAGPRRAAAGEVLPRRRGAAARAARAAGARARPRRPLRLRRLRPRRRARRLGASTSACFRRSGRGRR